MVSYTTGLDDQKRHHKQRSQSDYRLHSVQRLSASNTYKKPLNALAQLASGTAQPRVYNVKAVHFRELVQRLTGASSPGLQQHRAHLRPQSQPRPQPLAPSVPPYLLRPINQSQISIAEERVPYKVEHPFAAVPEEQQLFQDKDGGEELTLSPTFQPWFSLALLSPGSVL